MSRKLDKDIEEWAADLMNNIHKCGFSGINAVEKILRDPGISTKGSNHRVHWWPKNRRISRMSKAMHQIDKISQICLIVDSRAIMSDDGNIFTKYDLAKNSSLEVRRFNDYRKKAKAKLSVVLGI